MSNRLAGYLAAEAKIQEKDRQIALQRSPVVSSFFNLDHIANTPGSVGPSPSFADAFMQGLDQQYRIDSPTALQDELEDAWKPTLQALDARNGTNYYDQIHGTIGYLNYAGEATGQPMRYQSGFYSEENVKKNLDAFRKIDSEITKQNDPNLKSFKQILDEVSSMQQGVEEKTGRFGATGGTAGFVGGLLGSMAGSFTPRDPINLATLPVGGFGRAAATRIATEALAIGGITAFSDWGEVNPNRKLAGLPERSVAWDAVASGLGAGVLRGGGEAISHVAGKLFHEAPIEVHDAAVRATLEADGSPTARAGLDLLDTTQEIERASPYGDGRAGTTRFIAELQDAERALSGVSSKAELLASTAMRDTLPPIPIEQLERVADFQIVKEQAPDVWARVEEAQARVAELNVPREPLPQGLGRDQLPRSEQLSKQPLRMTRTDNGDGTFNLDVNTGEFPNVVSAFIEVDKEGRGKIDISGNGPGQLGLSNLREYMNEIKAQNPEIKSFVGERTTGVRSTLPAGDTRRLQTFSLARKEANAEYRTALAEAERTREVLNRIQRLRTNKANAEAVDLLGNSVRGTVYGPLLAHDIVERQATNLTSLAETQDDRALTSIHALTSPEGMVDIGLAKPVDENFRFFTGEDGKEMSVRQVLDDLKEDEKLEDAMRNCLL